MIEIFGLKTCDTCRKAKRALEANHADVTLTDVRDDPVDPAILREWFDKLGPQLLNTRSTTWRELSDQDRARPPLDLLAEHPALMKRPVIRDGERLFLGWDAKVQSALVG